MKLGDLVRVVFASKWQGLMGVVVEKGAWGGWMISTAEGVLRFEQHHLEIVE